MNRCEHCKETLEKENPACPIWHREVDKKPAEVVPLREMDDADHSAGEIVAAVGDLGLDWAEVPFSEWADFHKMVAGEIRGAEKRGRQLARDARDRRFWVTFVLVMTAFEGVKWLLLR